jgi:hypothetical protein
LDYNFTYYGWIVDVKIDVFRAYRIRKYLVGISSYAKTERLSYAISADNASSALD